MAYIDRVCIIAFEVWKRIQPETEAYESHPQVVVGGEYIAMLISKYRVIRKYPNPFMLLTPPHTSKNAIQYRSSAYAAFTDKTL